MSSLVLAGAASAMSACSSGTPVLPPDPNPVHIAAKPPPPISGGTLHVTKSGLAVAADSDRDLVWLVDLSSQNVRKVALADGDEPGRVAEDGAGRVHVALRGSGDLAIIDLASGKVVDRTHVCSAPRGVAYDAASDNVHVACAGGELVTLAAKDHAVVRSLRLDRDLRDVVVQNDRLLVTRFKSAEVIVLDGDGVVLNRQIPPQLGGIGGFGDGPPDVGGTTFTPTVAWRAVALPGGGVALAHQRSADSAVVVSTPDGYSEGGDPCGDGTIVNTTVTTVDGDGNDANGGNPAPSIIGATLPVDIATDGANNFAVVSAGSDSVFFTSTALIAQGAFSCGGNEGEADPAGQPTAVDFWGGSWIVQTREPAGLAVISNGSVSHRIELPGESAADTGHFLFHHAASKQTHLACSSCHPEGHEDGHIWHFDTIGSRRTQTVSGGVLDTAPLHWSGDMSDLGEIMHEVFVHRMGGTNQGPRHVAAFGDWMQTIKAHPASPTAAQASIDHGKELFNRPDVGCVSCHSGSHLTNNQNADVGTGESLQVPTLVGVAARAPFMHDGCAATLHDRFDPTKSACNGGDLHGKTSQLSASEIDDLVAYLETL